MKINRKIQKNKTNLKMQKFVVKKISRQTNLTIEEQQSVVQPKLDLERSKSSVKMCGYLKKKRNVSVAT